MLNDNSNFTSVYDAYYGNGIVNGALKQTNT